MEPFTFFDYTGLTNDEAASIKLFLEFTTKDKNNEFTIVDKVDCNPKDLTTTNFEMDLPQNNVCKHDSIEKIEKLLMDPPTVSEVQIPERAVLDTNLSNLDINSQSGYVKEGGGVETKMAAPTSWSSLFSPKIPNPNLSTPTTKTDLYQQKDNNVGNQLSSTPSGASGDQDPIFVQPMGGWEEAEDFPTLQSAVSHDVVIHPQTATPFISPLQPSPTFCKKVQDADIKDSIIPFDKDPVIPHITSILEMWLQNLENSCSSRSLYVARPLVNVGNWCYINSVLQALLSLPAFFTLFAQIGSELDRLSSSDPTSTIDERTSIPVTKAFAQFVSQNFVARNIDTHPNKDGRLDTGQGAVSIKGHLGTPFQPEQIYRILPVCQPDFAGRQEDAEEFLSAILNAIHEEMIAAILASTAAPPHNFPESSERVPSDVVGDDEWEKVGRKNKSTLTRETKIPTSPVSCMFGGVLRSHVQHACCKGSATLQPFFILPLDIQPNHVTTLNDALRHTFIKEHIPGYRCLKSKKSVDAYRILQIEAASSVLIFQLKSFIYDSSFGACQKLLKRIAFPSTLELDREILSQQRTTARIYKLRAFICHIGKSLQGGHYVTAFKCSDEKSSAKIEADWILADDAKMSRVRLSQLISGLESSSGPISSKKSGTTFDQTSSHPRTHDLFRNDTTPYLLFYTRMNE